MKSEISFLLELIFEHKLPKTTKAFVRARFNEVEACYEWANTKPIPRTSQPMGPQQAASTLAAMEKHGLVPPPPIVMPPVQQVAQSQQAMATLTNKHELISASIAGTPKTNADGSKRKW